MSISLLSLRRALVGAAGAGLTLGALLFGGSPAAHAAPPPVPGATFAMTGPHGSPDLPLRPGGGGGGHGGGGGGGHGGWGGPGGNWGGHGGNWGDHWSGWGGHGGNWGGHPGWGNGGWGPPGLGYRPWWNWWW